MGADLVCVAHLWWDWVWQRPQHLMTRFARRGMRLTYVEEPRIEIGEPAEGFDLVPAEEGVRVARLWERTDATTFRRLLDDAWRDHGGHPFDTGPVGTSASLMFGSARQPLLRERVVQQFPPAGRERPLVLWLYSPSVVDFIDLLVPDLVVFDVMDDLASFRFAPPQLVTQRDELLRRADIVLAGGPSLQDGVRGVRPDALLFPSGVDAEHFAPAREAGPGLPEPLAALRGPVAGYAGVIDERIDLDLLGALSAILPDWHWVMLGPVLKIDQGTLPRAPNLHYPGLVPYDALPAWLGGFDVGIMPFAANQATRSISPTKTLEYLAAGLPVVSTPVPDVLTLYGSVASFADSADSFAEAVVAAGSTGNPDAASVDALLRAGTWDSIADRMLAVVRARLR